MIFIPIVMLCMIYLAGSPDVHSFVELSKLDIGVFIILFPSFFGMLRYLSSIGKTTYCGNKIW